MTHGTVAREARASSEEPKRARSARVVLLLPEHSVTRDRPPERVQWALGIPGSVRSRSKEPCYAEVQGAT